MTADTTAQSAALTRIGEGDGAPGCGTWMLDPGTGRAQVRFRVKPVSTDPCDHRMMTSGHDPGKELRHVTNLRYGACSGPVCRRPARQCDHEHDEAYEQGGLTCLCMNDPKCRHCHQIKQSPGWSTKHNPDGSVTWTTPTGRQATTEVHRFPI